MRVAQGTVAEDGRVVVEGEKLPAGSRVAVYLVEKDGFHLDDASISELLEAQAEIRRGHYVSADAVLRELDSAT